MTQSPLTPAQKLKSLYALHVALGNIGGYESRIVTSKPERPVLAVRNLALKKLTETITVTEERGVRWFVWSWGEPMVPVSELDEAVKRVVYVLTPAAGAKRM